MVGTSRSGQGELLTLDYHNLLTDTLLGNRNKNPLHPTPWQYCILHNSDVNAN